MIYGLYFRFYAMTHNETLSCLLARLAYMVYSCVYFWKRLWLKKQSVTMTAEEAHRLIENTHADPKRRPSYQSSEVDPNVDLSIIVPIYNYAHLIEANIESVLNQKTSYRFELILVDDGSTDGAKEIVARYQTHPCVKVIFQQNTGIGGARNTGLSQAVGRYVMFIDCDDTVHDDLVEVLMSKAVEADYDIVMCAHNLSKEKNGEVYQVIPNVYPSKNLSGCKNGDEIMNYAGLPWCKVYKRELFENVRFFPGYWYEDTIIQMLVFTQCKKFAYVPKVEYEYRWYENNFSHVQGGKGQDVRSIDRYWILKAILEQYDQMGLPHDGQFYALLVKHLSVYYYPPVSGLEPELVEALFVLANELLEKYRPEKPYKLPRMLRVTEKAILEKNISLWKLATYYQ